MAEVSTLFGPPRSFNELEQQVRLVRPGGGTQVRVPAAPGSRYDTLLYEVSYGGESGDDPYLNLVSTTPRQAEQAPTPTPTPTPRSRSGGSARSAVPPPPQFAAPRPAGRSAPGQRVFSEKDFEKMYATWIDKGQKLIQQLEDPNFLNMTAAAMAMKFEPPPGWEQLLRGGLDQPQQAAPFDPRTVSNPFRLLLQQGTNALPNPGTQSGTQAQQGFISDIPTGGGQ